jgi:hypothetical protein
LPIDAKPDREPNGSTGFILAPSLWAEATTMGALFVFRNTGNLTSASRDLIRNSRGMDPKQKKELQLMIKEDIALFDDRVMFGIRNLCFSIE